MRHVKKIFLGLVVLVSILTLVGCKPNTEFKEFKESKKFKVVATTTMLGDLVKQLTKDNAIVHTVIGEGVDPHKYEVTALDRKYFDVADAIVISGLHLEAHMGEALDKYKDKKISAEDGLRADSTIWEDITKNHVWDDADDVAAAKAQGINELYDPHFWFNIGYWKQVAKHVSEKLPTLDTKNTDKAFYQTNYNEYAKQLDEAHTYVLGRANELDASKRILFTAHDAFNYFASAYGFKVEAVQGISTESEATQESVDQNVQKAMENNIHILFIETSVPKTTLEAVKQTAQAKKYKLELSEKELCSDSLDTSIGAGTYINMVKYNIDTIVDGIKKSLQ